MDAIVTAGGVPLPGDPLYVYSNGNSKALIDISGKPMVQWVLDALGESKKVDNVIVIGLSPKSGRQAHCIPAGPCHPDRRLAQKRVDLHEACPLHLQSGTHACEYCRRCK